MMLLSPQNLASGFNDSDGRKSTLMDYLVVPLRFLIRFAKYSIRSYREKKRIIIGNLNNNDNRVHLRYLFKLC